jgi:hypothetical protein
MSPAIDMTTTNTPSWRESYRRVIRDSFFAVSDGFCEFKQPSEKANTKARMTLR